MELHDPYWEQAGDEIAKARFHDLRHTHATELLRAGVHIKVVAERLGDSETTVMKIYSHVLPDMRETRSRQSSRCCGGCWREVPSARAATCAPSTDGDVSQKSDTQHNTSKPENRFEQEISPLDV